MKLIVLLIAMILFQPQGGMDIKNPWIRPGVKGMNTAAYFEIRNNSSQNDTLYNVKSNIAKVTELHETYMKGDQMGMRRANYIVLKAGSSFSFKPGEHHVMLIGLKEDVKEGSQKEFTLYFRKAGEVKVKAQVKK